MKALLLSLLISVACCAQTDAQLETLKAQFPAHVAGQITSQSDPWVRELFEKYEARIRRATIATLGDDLIWMRREIQRDVSFCDYEPRRKNNKLTGAQKHACRQNLSWLKQKLTPYVARLAQLQRGR